MLSAIKSAHAAYSTSKSVYTAVTKPTQFLRDQLVSALTGILVRSCKAAVGEAVTEAALGKLEAVSKTVTFGFKVPTAASTYLEAPDALGILNGVANDVLAAPLALVGYSLGVINIEFDAPAQQLTFQLELHLQKTSSVAALSA